MEGEVVRIASGYSTIPLTSRKKPVIHDSSVPRNDSWVTWTYVQVEDGRLIAIKIEPEQQSLVKIGDRIRILPKHPLKERQSRHRVLSMFNSKLNMLIFRYRVSVELVSTVLPLSVDAVPFYPYWVLLEDNDLADNNE